MLCARGSSLLVRRVFARLHSPSIKGTGERQLSSLISHYWLIDTGRKELKQTSVSVHQRDRRKERDRGSVHSAQRALQSPKQGEKDSLTPPSVSK